MKWWIVNIYLSTSFSNCEMLALCYSNLFSETFCMWHVVPVWVEIVMRALYLERGPFVREFEGKNESLNWVYLKIIHGSNIFEIMCYQPFFFSLYSFTYGHTIKENSGQGYTFNLRLKTQGRVHLHWYEIEL